MGIRIQPKEIEVPANEPFKYDLLGRQGPIETLTRLLTSIEGPCVLAIDAPWGTGKTTFLRMWKQHLRNQGFPIVDFNAWETDFSEDPLVALTAEITSGLEAHLDPNSGIDMRTIKKRAGKILLAIGSNAVRVATQNVVDLAAITAKDEEESSADIRIKTHLEIQGYISEFKDSLQIAASKVRKIEEGRSIVVVIDELDRCRPTYAIELLEAAKHLFSVDDIIFVLATSKTTLAHSVRAVYGSEFDAEGYLRRFFDIDVRLPEPNRAKFIRALFDAVGLQEYFDRSSSQFASFDKDPMEKLLLRFLDTPDFSLRRIAQAIHRLGLVLGSLPKHELAFGQMAAFALVLRTVDATLYHRFTQGEVSDLEVVENLHNRHYSNDFYGRNTDLALDAMAIVAAQKDIHSDRLSSPLLDKYHEQAGSWDGESYEAKYAKAVIQLVEGYGYPTRVMMTNAFGDAVKSLELVSPNLVDLSQGSEKSC